MVSATAVSDYRLPTRLTPIVAEFFGPLEPILLAAYMMTLGWFLPRGKGQVIAVEGFLSPAFFMGGFESVLRGLGYTTHDAGIPINRGCPDRKIDALVSRVNEVSDQTGEKVSVIGHSLGGTFGALATERTERIKQVICLASPLSAEAGFHPVMGMAYQSERHRANREESCSEDCFTPRCPCRFGQRMAEGGLPRNGTPIHTISTFTDGIVSWESTKHPDPESGSVVFGSHTFLPYNPLAVRQVAKALASA